MSAINEAIATLATISDAKVRVEKRDGRTFGVLTLQTASGPFEISLDQFDAIYAGMVRCWPEIKPAKVRILEARRAEKLAEAAALWEARDAAKKADREKQRAERDKARKMARKGKAGGRKKTGRKARPVGAKINQVS